MTITAIVTGTGLRNDDGSSRARVIRRRCALGCEVVLRKGPTTHKPDTVAVYLEVPRLFGLLRSSYAQIGDLEPRAAALIVARLEAEKSQIRARVKSLYAPEEKDSPRVSLFID
jgi:hypothetical protein